MVARRQTRDRRVHTTPDDAARAALAAVPVVDEDPTAFWGADFWEVKAEIEAEQAAAPRRVFSGDEEFEAFLNQFSQPGADVRGE